MLIEHHNPTLELKTWHGRTIAHNAYNNTKTKNQCPQVVTYQNHKTPTMHHPQTHPILLCNLNAHKPLMRTDQKKGWKLTNNYKIHHSAYTQSKAQLTHDEHENYNMGKTKNLYRQSKHHTHWSQKAVKHQTNAHDKTHTGINTTSRIG